MNKREAESILLALDGISAGIETLRELIAHSVEEKAPESRTETAKKILDADDECTHMDMKVIETMAGEKSYCFDCGYEE